MSWLCCSFSEPERSSNTLHIEERENLIKGDGKKGNYQSTGYPSTSTITPHQEYEARGYKVPGGSNYTTTSEQVASTLKPSAADYNTPKNSPEGERKRPLTPQSGGGYSSKSASDVSTEVSEDF